MSFYKREGSGRHSQDEQMLIDAIEKLIDEKGIPREQVPQCHSIDELLEVKHLLENYEGEPQAQEVLKETTSDEQVLEPIPPTDEPTAPEAAEEPEPFELTEQREPEQSFEDDYFIEDNYNPFADPIIERSYTQNQGNTEQQETDEEPLELEDSGGSPLSDLPPHTKRRAAEQTADTLLKGYAQFAPMPFKWMAKLPEAKIEKMAFNGEIDLSLEVNPGTTFDDYMKQTNQQVDELFKVDEETLSDIREPLIEVLMEQNMELTPAQRLTAAIISHLAQMFTIALKLRQQNNRILSYQKQLTFLAQGGRVA